MMCEYEEENPLPSKNVLTGNPGRLDANYTREALLDEFNKLRKWREEQFKQFCSIQSQSDPSQMNDSSGRLKNQFEDADHSVSNFGAGDNWRKDLGCNIESDAAVNSDVSGSSTLQESSITGHLQRCFNDSNQSSPSVLGNKVAYDVINPPLLSGLQGGKFSEKILNAGKDKKSQNAEQNSAETKPKKPFLRKGSGLMRYQPKSRPIVQKAPLVPLSSNSQRTAFRGPPNAPKLKPALRTSTAQPEATKHIRFDLPDDVPERNGELDHMLFCPSKKPESESPESHANIESSKFVDKTRLSFKDAEGPLNPAKETSNLSKEKKELEEFELLENIAQNSSFNSDSSFVQRVLHGENILGPENQSQRSCSAPENINRGSTEKTSPKRTENPIFSAKMGLSKFLEEVHARKQILEKDLSDINPRIQSLQREINGCDDHCLNTSDQSDHCSSPVEDISPKQRDLQSVLETGVSDDPELSMDVEGDLCGPNCNSCSVDGDHKDNYHRPLDKDALFSDSSPEEDVVRVGKLKMREKMAELQKEIEKQEEYNKRLESICKERDDIVRKLKKEQEDFNKFKESEKKKLEAQMQEERKQIKRQKETFLRYQKLRKDNPTRKEREEFNSLRQEIEELREELKRQKIKYNADVRRLISQFETAERERDTLRLENIRLEEQVQDLLTALKVRLKNNPKTLDKPAELTRNEKNIAPDKSNEALPHTASPEEQPSKKNNTILPKKPVILSRKSTVQKESSSKKETCNQRSNLTNGSCPVLISDPESVRACSDDDSTKAINKVVDDFTQTEPSKNGTSSDLSEPPRNGSLSDLSEPPSEQGSTPTPVVEVLQQKTSSPSSNLSVISVTIESEFREVNHGNKVERIYKTGEREIIFKSGTRKLIASDGKVKNFFSNGDKKEIFPDGREIYTFVNGIIETSHPDGLKVIEFPSGQIQCCYPDGKKEVKFPDGTTHNLYADGSEEIKANGNVVKLGSDGSETILLSNGQKEIRTSTYRRREFPDGSSKTIYACGRQETRYPDGRIKIKDKEGNTIIDTKYPL